ncbi:TIGR00730 family Rossman fold protein [Candidatus Kaiserbacteria bacterium]|nr:TIGR00730 family Rossman fold protein [Candidatus Kaiserbacteria bacterium]
MNICIFCSASDVDKKYTDTARELAILIARGQHTLVWGGSNKGTMRVIADAAQGAGGKIVGITMELLKVNARSNADEMHVMKNLPERKAKLLERSDAIIVLPGGLGTIDEITEVLELKKHKVHNKAIVFLNTADFYAGFKMQLERMDAEGFLPRPLSELLFFSDTPEDAMRYITEYGN